MKMEPISPRLWRLLAFAVFTMGLLYLIASPACQALIESETQRREEAQFSEP